MYDTHHVVFKPLNFTVNSLQWAQIKSHEVFYSVCETLKKIFQRRWLSMGIALYARYINFKWKRNNKAYLDEIKNIQRQWP
jgi:hypothetical protein